MPVVLSTLHMPNLFWGKKLQNIPHYYFVPKAIVTAVE